MNTENFYFESFDADYYLSRGSDGISKLDVVENFTTIFPNYNQNKGICREIPFTNQAGTNTTLPTLSRANITVLRNGLAEPIYSIDKYSDYFEVCTGDDNYVTGRQVYTFKYSFEKVVTDFTDYQELYWDTNGNGWSQKFNSVTARVHFLDSAVLDNYSGESWCYVGKYGESGSERCEITELSDGVSFTANNLTKYENLTFDTQFDAGTFVVPEPEVSYALLYGFLLVLGISALFLISPLRKFFKTRKKIKFYNEFFVKPEYQPAKEYSLAEMSEVFIGTKKDVKVGILLDLIVRKKINLVKKESQIFKTEKWALKILDLEGLRVEELAVLAILNGGTEVEVGDTVEIRTRTADSTLVRLAKKFSSTVIADLKRDGLVETSFKGSTATVQMPLIIWVFLFFWGMPMVFAFIEVFLEGFGGTAGGKILFGEKVFPILSLIAVIAAIATRVILNKKTKKFSGHTLKGLEMSRYMDGLKLYIKMAEADRLKFLQSVEGADTSNEGIVKLYEKLLPYAAIFGLEESWMKELEKYYQIEEVTEPDWFVAGVTAAEMSRVMRNAALTAQRASVPVSSGGSGISGGGGSSSSFSGGGGGGFSGGGGGGGGGHGR